MLFDGRVFLWPYVQPMRGTRQRMEVNVMMSEMLSLWPLPLPQEPILVSRIKDLFAFLQRLSVINCD